MHVQLLIVEDDPDLAAALTVFLKEDNSGLSVDVAGSVEAALRELKLKPYAVVILDIGLPDGGGFEVLDEIRKGLGWTPADTRVAVYSALGADCVADIAEKRGADTYFPKSQVGIMLLRGWVKVAIDGMRRASSTRLSG